METIFETNADLLYKVRLVVDGPFKDEEKIRKEARKYSMRQDGRQAFIFRKGDKVCGYVEVKLGEVGLPDGAPTLPELDGLGHVARIGVVENERGQGIGRDLLNEAERHLRSCGTKGVWLDYLADNKVACSLYQKAGYTDVTGFVDARNRKRRIAVKKW